ncbi:unnamed protein product [Paramecium primaurelia]|uniref:Transmembrane protein n=1 Tax=Paramecium primaurelia TaxID=5886 RepID=A0A8S1NYP7_PARPR|nr:unnamed protein product [Paramecium primaurelia]
MIIQRLQLMDLYNFLKLIVITPPCLIYVEQLISMMRQIIQILNFYTSIIKLILKFLQQIMEIMMNFGGFRILKQVCISVAIIVFLVTQHVYNVKQDIKQQMDNVKSTVVIHTLHLMRNVMTETQFNLMDAMNASINVLKAAIYVTKETAYQNVKLGFLLMARNAYLFVEILILHIQKNVMMGTNLKTMDVIIA